MNAEELAEYKRLTALAAERLLAYEREQAWKDRLTELSHKKHAAEAWPLLKWFFLAFGLCLFTFYIRF